MWESIYGICSLPLIYVSILLSIPHYIDDCIFIINFEIGYYVSSNFIFSPNFRYLTSFALYVGFEKLVGLLIGVV